MYMIAEVSQYVAVASFAEAWIEIVRHSLLYLVVKVASFAEAWIEMLNAIDGKCCSCVASFAEAWIEIIFPLDLGVLRSRLLRGGVD